MLSGASIVWACSFEDETDASVFTPEYFVNKHYSPFFYDSYNRYYLASDTSQETNNNSRYVALVSNEWKAFLGKQLSASEIDFLLFTASIKQADSVKKIVAAKLDGHGKTFFNYLPLMRDCETFSINDADTWYAETNRKRVPINLEKRITNALNAYQDKFIRERLWFQLVRYNYFQDTTGKKVKPAFYRYEKEFPHNLTYYRTLGYLAGAEYEQKDYAHANYHYSLCYNYTWQMYIPSEWSFHPQEEADWKQTLKLAKTTNEKITLWHLLGIAEDAGRAIKEIVKLNPKSEKLELLLSRVVNIAEGTSLTPSVDDSALNYNTAFAFKNDAATARHVDSLNNAAYAQAYQKAYANALKVSLARDKDLQMVDSVAATKSIRKPYFWHLASGYMHYLHCDYQAARKFYSAAKKELPPGNKELAAQYKLLDILLTVKTIKKIDAETEARLVEPLNWLADLRDDKIKVVNFRFASALLTVTDTIGGMYFNQHNVTKSAFFKEAPPVYADSSAINKIVQVMLKANKTPFEKTMLRFYPNTLDQLYYQQALLATYKENIPAAVAFMKKATLSNASALPANPFNSRLNDCHDCEFETSVKDYTPLKFLQTIKLLKDNLQAGKDKYNSALLLGGAYHNITHYGNSRVFFQNNLSGYANQPEDYSNAVHEMFTSPAIAEKYYALALQYASNNEQRAKCAFLLSKCERNTNYNDNNVNAEGIPPAGQWFKTLKSKYQATSYYKEILKECGYFKQFVTNK